MLLYLPTKTSSDSYVYYPAWTTKKKAPVLIQSGGDVYKLVDEDNHEIFLGRWLNFNNWYGCLVDAGKEYKLYYYKNNKWEHLKTFKINHRTGELGFFVEIDEKKYKVDFDFSLQNFSFSFESEESVEKVNLGFFVNDKFGYIFKDVEVISNEWRLEYSGRKIYKYLINPKIKHIPKIYGFEEMVDENSSATVLIEYLRKNGYYFYFAENGLYCLPPTTRLFAEKLDFGDLTEEFKVQKVAEPPVNKIIYWQTQENTIKKLKKFIKSKETTIKSYLQTQEFATIPSLYLTTNLLTSSWIVANTPLYIENILDAIRTLKNARCLFFIWVGIPANKASRLVSHNELYRFRYIGTDNKTYYCLIWWATSEEGIDWFTVNDKDYWFTHTFLEPDLYQDFVGRIQKWTKKQFFTASGKEDIFTLEINTANYNEFLIKTEGNTLILNVPSRARYLRDSLSFKIKKQENCSITGVKEHISDFKTCDGVLVYVSVSDISAGFLAKIECKVVSLSDGNVIKLGYDFDEQHIRHETFIASDKLEFIWKAEKLQPIKIVDTQIVERFVELNNLPLYIENEPYHILNMSIKKNANVSVQLGQVRKSLFFNCPIGIDLIQSGEEKKVRRGTIRGVNSDGTYIVEIEEYGLNKVLSLRITEDLKVGDEIYLTKNGDEYEYMTKKLKKNEQDKAFINPVIELPSLQEFVGEDREKLYKLYKIDDTVKTGDKLLSIKNGIVEVIQILDYGFSKKLDKSVYLAKTKKAALEMKSSHNTCRVGDFVEFDDNLDSFEVPQIIEIGAKFKKDFDTFITDMNIFRNTILLTLKIETATPQSYTPSKSSSGGTGKLIVRINGRDKKVNKLVFPSTVGFADYSHSDNEVIVKLDELRIADHLVIDGDGLVHRAVYTE